MSTGFSHRDPGTPERRWLDDPRLHLAPALRAVPVHLVVVAAHPDDETLGAGGLIRRTSCAGGRVTVIVASDGEASHPDSPTHTPQRLARLRREEVADAVHLLDGDADIRFLGVPDGRLEENSARLGQQLAEILDDVLAGTPAGQVLVVSPWSGDGHRDHRIAEESVAQACARRGIAQLAYPVWFWHWGEPDAAPWTTALAVRLTTDEIDAKKRAIARHTTQVRPLSPAVGDEAIVHDGMRSHFERDVEIYFVAPGAPTDAPDDRSLDASFFEDFYRRHDDPWGFESRWYETRKRDVLAASLPRARLGTVLEIGCSTGLVTRMLVDRSDSILAMDPVDTALDAARRRVGDDSRVQFRRGSVPGDWPGGRFDTIVLSEVGYYLSPPDLAATLTLVDRSLSPNGVLVACHWRPFVPDYPQTGDAVHDAIRAGSGWRVTVRHEEKDFLLEVFSRPPALSVAEEEGFA